MNDFITRLQEEKAQLEERMDKLGSFMLSATVVGLDDVQRALLQVQAMAMNTYLQCLKERLQRLSSSVR